MEFNEIKTEKELHEVAGMAKEIWNECYADLLTKEQIDYMVGRFQTKEAMERQIREEGYHYYWVKDERKPAGYLGVCPKDGKLLVSKFYLLAGHRGKGLAGGMFDHVEKLCREFGCHSYWLTVNKENARAVAAYRRRGMEMVREQVVDIGSGFVMDDYVFEKRLENAE